MSSRLKDLLKSLETSGTVATSIRRGIEREALRVDPDGGLARSPHPVFLGSKLCHPQITTDFSESQLEFVTPVFNDIKSMLTNLDEIHRYVHGGLEDQLLWSASMPCVLHNDTNIPLAQYGNSNLGQLKTTYRNGLGLRYGRAMQTICAVHYNFSFADDFWNHLQKLEQDTSDTSAYKSRRYFDLMRNFRRYSWLLVYLFGSSPAVCNTFVKGRPHDLTQFDEGTLYAEGATSLRSGNLGYESDAQKGLIGICYNSLSNYVKTLTQAITTSHKDYQNIGLREGDEYLQVNTNVLQSEAEFYTTIRAKRVPAAGANFLDVLMKEGVEYVEIRLLDVDPYDPLGISEEQIHFLDLFMLYCLLEESPVHNDAMCKLVDENLSKTVYQGRIPDLKLQDENTERTLKDWGMSLLTKMSAVADLLDKTNATTNFTRSLNAQIEKLEDVDKTPSARILADMSNQSIPFFRFAMNQSIKHKSYFQSHPLPNDRRSYFETIANDSFLHQAEIESLDKESFPRYLKKIEQGYLDLLSRLK